MENLDVSFFDRCSKGDADAFRPVVIHYQEFAHAVAFRILQHEEDARDVVQESFVRVWKNISKFDARKSFSTWLYRIVTRLCLDRLKSRKRRLKMLD
ncbi:sigma-70 family RNA polymerase sigma factor, partial [bacterium]|nr:sigma-70 family RNA polymerase sigma factor [bacterium]